jgi:integrase/recombinase XerD
VASLRNKLTWANCPDRKKKPLSPTTINTYARGVRAFWGWLKAEQIIDPNPLAAVKAPKLPRRIPKVYTEDQLRMVLKTVERRPREIAIIETFLDSGMRLSELTGLSIKDVNLKTGTIKVFGKGSKERFVYISPMTSLKIEEYLTTRSSIVDEDPVFATIDGRPLSLNRVQVILQEVGKKAGIGERLAPHKLRHTYATMSLRNGSNLEYLRIAMGHTDIKTTSDCYLAMSNQDIALAHRRFSPMANLKIPKRSGNG